MPTTVCIRAHFCSVVFFDECIVDSANLRDSLGFFGGAHQDQHDDPAALTGMISWPHLAPRSDAGTFHVLEYGVFIPLDGLKVMFFNGLRRHGGSAPRAPADEDAQPWAYRFVIVCYPPAAIVEDHGISALASLRSPNTDKKGHGKKERGLFTIDMAVKNKFRYIRRLFCCLA